ncbi:MAG TPA: 1-deoxy-D-xylulose-5-phosphate reductoisomerase [Candidatus Methylomirabilis sp.]
MKRLAILGSTGSIGTSTLAVVESHPEEFAVVALAAGANMDRLAQQVRVFRPSFVSVASEAAAQSLRERLDGAAVRLEIGWGSPGLVRAATHRDADLVVSAIVGGAGLVPTLAAVRSGKDVALANKESLVMAGELVMAAARATGARILPVDSEHSAVFQCLLNGGREGLRRVVLTASGGPFRSTPRSEFPRITPAQALRHPTWNMGRKITIDSATLMNKGLEVIEARWLFDLDVTQVDVIVHPQSIIHSLVEFVDGSILAQLGITDMRLPILYALRHPERGPSALPRLKLEEVATLTFEPVDREKFPCLSYAYRALEGGGTLPAVLNAANEVAVHQFLEGAIRFDQIADVIARALDAHPARPLTSVEDLLELDRTVRRSLNAVAAR